MLLGVLHPYLHRIHSTGQARSSTGSFGAIQLSSSSNPSSNINLGGLMAQGRVATEEGGSLLSYPKSQTLGRSLLI
jgi:hypothetical protein